MVDIFIGGFVLLAVAAVVAATFVAYRHRTASRKPSHMDVLFQQAEERAKERGVDHKTLGVLEEFEVRIARDPNDAYAYARMGLWWHWKKEYAKALDHLNTAVRLDGNFAHALFARADLRATCPDAAYRDGKSAVNDASRAMNVAREEGKRTWGVQHRRYLNVLAAAYAEAGDFHAAIRTEKEALALAMTEETIRKIETTLAKYKLRKPIREGTTGKIETNLAKYKLRKPIREHGGVMRLGI